MKSKNFYFLCLSVILSLLFGVSTASHAVCNSHQKTAAPSIGLYKNSIAGGVGAKEQSEIQHLQSEFTTIQSMSHNQQINKSAIIQKTQKLRMPFIVNDGQVDATVKFYAKTFGGNVFVTKDGEIVYSLPSVESKDAGYTMQGKKSASLVDHVSDIVHHDDKSTIGNPISAIQGLALKEEFVGGKVAGIRGESNSVTKVNYFIGNDPSQWKNNVSTYDVVDLGEIYSDINVKLKAYGNNVEKLFYVMPGADPDQIKIRLSGANPSKFPLNKGVYRGLSVNEHGELEVESELGTVTFTKPVAYQEINGKRVEVEYSIQNPEGRSQNTDFQLSSFNLQPETCNSKLVYGFKVASYDKTKDLIIDPLLASTYLGGSDNLNYGFSLALDTSGNVYVTGVTGSTDFPTTSGAFDTSINGYGSYDVFVSKLDSGLSAADTIPPTVSTTSPDNGATDVAVNSTITATFSEAIDPSTLITGGQMCNPPYSVTVDTGTILRMEYTTGYHCSDIRLHIFVDGTLKLTTDFISLLTSTGMLDLGPVSPGSHVLSLQAEGRVGGCNSGLLGSWVGSLFVESPDATPPMTLSIPDLSVGCVESSFIVSDNNGNIVGGTVTSDGTIVTFTPSGNLSPSTTYTAMIDTDVKDLAGNAMASPYTFSFTTGAAPDTTPPTVSSTSPDNGATGIAVNPTFAIRGVYKPLSQ